jgi:CubicO group peptidase (beta-lactamase class C family)
MSPSRVAYLFILLVTTGCAQPPPPVSPPAAPESLEAFTAAAARILEEAAVPGAGIALVRAGGVEWAGGIGLADREQRTPVTADTHFRAGSISKTFVAMSLVQQYEDGELDLDAPVSEFVPSVAIDNRFGAPVTVLNLLQHTAGFDDMHFNERDNLTDPPDLPLLEVLARNPASRRVRWQPGTRMSYSNPGYAVAAAVLEQVSGRPYEDLIRDRIFAPLGMRTSSFVLTPADEAALARGYDSPSGAAVPPSQIYLRPAGNLHTSAAELGRFVQMLLNWGETSDLLVIDPEYLSNMERPRTSLSAKAGLIYGYGTGIASRSLAGFPVLGHDGRIDGFSASYGYSAGRDVGWVILVNASYGGTAVDRLSALALSYLKRDVAPPAGPELAVDPAVLTGHEGYYQPEGFRAEVFGAMEWLTGGTTVRAEGNGLWTQPILGPPQRLVPTSDNLFRESSDVTPSLVFTTDDEGRTVMLEDGRYGVRMPRWRVEAIRVPILLAVILLASVPPAILLWLVRMRAARPAGFWTLKLALLVLPLALLALCNLPLWVPGREWGVPNLWTRLTFIGSAALPIFSIVALVLVGDAWRRDAGPWLLGYALAVTGAGLGISAYIAVWGLVGIRPWVH